jgi:hypothetical protein
VGLKADRRVSISFRSLVAAELHKNFQFMGPTEALIELLEDFSAYCRHDTVTHLITEKQVLVLVPAPIASNAPSYTALRSPRVRCFFWSSDPPGRG